MLKPKRQIAKYVVADYFSALLSWVIFFYYRKIYIEKPFIGEVDFSFNNRLIIGLAILPFCWLLFYYLTGHYRSPYYRSRLQELGQTFYTTLVGTTILFFVLFLDDFISSYKDYYLLYITFFSIHFVLTYIPRLIITSRMIRRLRSGRIAFNTVFLGGGKRCLDFYNEVKNTISRSGLKVIGFVAINRNSQYEAVQCLPMLGYLDEIDQIIKKHNIREIIISPDSSEREQLEWLISQIEFYDVKIKLIPEIYNIITARAVTSGLYDAPLLEISKDLMPAWQENTKRFMDIVGSILFMTVGIPLYIILAIGVKLSSKGPIIYSHERIGRFGKPFKIYKFRSMVVDAEKNGPALSSKNDSRITPFGRFLRKTRLDEIPQFYNVLKGDMSLVGPRPERQYYIDQIVPRAPLFRHLLRVRPGITSWGQVKFGYAENVDQMIERLRYDLIYIENMSIYFDIKIMIYTIKTVFQASGK